MQIKNKLRGVASVIGENEKFSSIDELEKLLRATCLSGSTFEDIWHNLAQLIMTDKENIEEYLQRGYKIFSDLSDRNKGDNNGLGEMDNKKIEQKVIKHVINGLPRDVKIECKSASYKNFVEAWAGIKKVYNEYEEDIKLRAGKTVNKYSKNK